MSASTLSRGRCPRPATTTVARSPCETSSPTPEASPSTGSAGTRTDKATILASFDAADEQGESEPGPVYSAEDVQLKWYGDTAVVAFKLVATPPDESPVLYYFNTGTFLKRDGEWRVVAWQATKIPPVEE